MASFGKRKVVAVRMKPKTGCLITAGLAMPFNYALQFTSARAAGRLEQEDQTGEVLWIS
jgi:hypothetical protein